MIERCVFGTAGLLREANADRRVELLQRAIALGVRRFDTAPSYGLGLSESALGSLSQLERSHIEITTKFGLAPSLLARVLSNRQSQLRRLMNSNEHVRTAVRRIVGRGMVTAQQGSTTQHLRKSLEASLVRLRQPKVESLLLHDVVMSAQTLDLLRGMVQLRSEGLLDRYGISVKPGTSLKTMEEIEDVDLWQVGSPALVARVAGLSGEVRTYGVLGARVAQVRHRVKVDPVLRGALSEVLNMNLRGVELLVPALLVHEAIFRRGASTVVVSTTNEVHLDDLCAGLREVGTSELVVQSRLADPTHSAL